MFNLKTWHEKKKLCMFCPKLKWSYAKWYACATRLNTVLKLQSYKSDFQMDSLFIHVKARRKLQKWGDDYHAPIRSVLRKSF